MTKFKKGERVRYKGSNFDYHIRNYYNPKAEKGDIFTISAVREDYYGFVENTSDTSAHWCSVEEYFESAPITNWNDLIEGDSHD